MDTDGMGKPADLTCLMTASICANRRIGKYGAGKYFAMMVLGPCQAEDAPSP